MKKYIDADALKVKIYNGGLWNDARAAIFEILDNAPAADVAEVVRCKDCRYFDVTQTYLCDMHHRAANEDDYCSYGIRKMDSEKEGV